MSAPSCCIAVFVSPLFLFASYICPPPRAVLVFVCYVAPAGAYLARSLIFSTFLVSAMSSLCLPPCLHPPPASLRCYCPSLLVFRFPGSSFYVPLPLCLVPGFPSAALSYLICHYLWLSMFTGSSSSLMALTSVCAHVASRSHSRSPLSHYQCLRTDLARADAPSFVFACCH